MAETHNINPLGKVLITGGSGFLGKTFVETLLDRGYSVRVLDVNPCQFDHPDFEMHVGNICDIDFVSKACEGVDTVFHTAAIIELRDTKMVDERTRKLSYDVNLEGTKNIVKACQKQGVKRLVYTSSNSVVLDGNPITNGNESLPYVTTFRDLYTETKTKAEQYVLKSNGEQGLLTAAIRPSGIWGVGDQTVFKTVIEQLHNGLFKVIVGDGSAKLDNSYVHNLIHGQILAANQLYDGGSAPGQAYFINDGEPVNMMYFIRPVVETLGYKFPKMHVPYLLVRGVLEVWQWLHLNVGIKQPPQPPLALARVCKDNYFSIEKARRDLGYEPLYTSEEAMEHCIPYYIELHNELANG